jgi:hypothetical protein
VFDIENCVMEVMSKSSSQHLARLWGKLKLTEKERYIHIHKFNIFQYSNVLVIS